MSPWTDSENRAGYTLLELIIVLVIVGILFYAGARMSTGQRSQEIQLGEVCESDLRVIFNAEKAYLLEKGGYAAAVDAPAIYQTLGVSIPDSHFAYRIQAGPRQFKAVATRKSGRLCEGMQMSITQTGDIVKECAVWRKPG